MIYHFMPFSTEKDYVKEINKYIALVPNPDDWICIWDGDTCRTISTWGNTIEKAIAANKEFDLLTGTATRVGGGHGNLQKINNEVSYSQDMVRLHKICLRQEKKYEDLRAIEVDRNIIGFLYMFRRSLTDEIPFVSDLRRGGILDWDTNWCQRVRDAGKRVGVIPGIAVYHHYRLHKQRKDETHLH